MLRQLPPRFKYTQIRRILSKIFNTFFRFHTKLDFVMKRKSYDQLVLWKTKRHGKSAMVIEGARRVGKSYIIEEFAKKHFERHCQKIKKHYICSPVLLRASICAL